MVVVLVGWLSWACGGGADAPIDGPNSPVDGGLTDGDPTDGQSDGPTDGPIDGAIDGAIDGPIDGPIDAGIPTPTDLVATMVSPSRVHLAWQPVTGAASYQVLRGPGPGLETVLATASQASYDDDQLVSGELCWQVTAVGGGATSPRSNEVCLTIDLTPAAPTNVTATAVSATRIDVGWTAVAGASSYDVYQATGAGTFARAGTATAPPFAAMHLEPSTTYRYVVRAIASDGSESPDSAEASATTPHGQCFVPSTHPTVTAALADPACFDIRIAAGTYTERVTIDRDVRVRGIGAVVLDGEAGGSVVTITSAATAVVIQDLTIRNGKAPRGGGLLVHGGTTLRRVRVENNVAESALVGEGGGIYCDHVELVLEDTIIIGNRASTTDLTSTEWHPLGGGGVFHEGFRLRITGGSIEQNRVTGGATNLYALGGGIVMLQDYEFLALTEFTIDGTVVRENTIELTGSSSRGTGGGIYFSGAAGPADKLTLANARVEANRIVAASGAGGGLMSLLETGFGGSPTVEIVGTTVSANRLELGTGDGRGGGIYIIPNTDDHYDLNLVLDHAHITGNVIVGGEIRGGGVAFAHGHQFEGSGVGSTFSITHSEIAGNELQGMTPDGGGIYYQCHICDSELALSQSTVSGNRSMGSQGAKNGGIATEDIRRVHVVDSTISGNEARASSGPARGGGIGVQSYEISRAYFASSTISANLVTGSDAAGGGIYFEAVSDESNPFEDQLTATFANTIVAQNSGSDCVAELDRATVFYEARSAGYNLFGSMGTCTVIAGPGDQNGANALLLPLADNGGATRTHALGATSPARDLGDPAGCKAPDGSTLAVDQRDLARVANGRCDIGSFETQ